MSPLATTGRREARRGRIPPQQGLGEFLGFYLRTRVLQCRCGPQMKLPTNDRHRLFGPAGKPRTKGIMTNSDSTHHPAHPAAARETPSLNDLTCPRKDSRTRRRAKLIPTALFTPATAEQLNSSTVRPAGPARGRQDHRALRDTVEGRCGNIR